MKKRPRSAILGRQSTIVIVLQNSAGQIFRMANVKAAREFTPQHIEIERH